MKLLKTSAILGIGILIGSVVTGTIMKKKYEEIIDEEIQSVKDRYSKKEEVKEEEVKEEVKDTIDDTDEILRKNPLSNKEMPEHVMDAYRERYADILERNGYTYENEYEPEDDPYIIDPEEFDVLSDYGSITLTYFSDGVLVDDVDEVIEDPEEYIGNALTILDESYECRAVYVRNDIFKMDYEILKDDWTWKSIQESEEKLYEKNNELNKKPHQL